MFGIGGEHDLTERELPHLSGWRDSRPGPGRQRGVEPAADRRLRRAARRRPPPGRAARPTLDRRNGGSSSSRAPTRRPGAGARPTRASGRSAANPATSSTRSSCAGWRSTGPSRWRSCCGRRTGSEWLGGSGGGPRGDPHPGLERHRRVVHPVLRLPRPRRVVPDDPIVGFLPADDPRVLATIDAVAERLTDDRGLVYRYRTAPAAPPTAWPARRAPSCSARSGWHRRWPLAGQVDRARAVFERAVLHANDVGLLAEEVDPATGDLLGNFPQALSHIGLVNAAWAINQAEARCGTDRRAGRRRLTPISRLHESETVVAETRRAWSSRRVVVEWTITAHRRGLRARRGTGGRRAAGAARGRPHCGSRSAGSA